MSWPPYREGKERLKEELGQSRLGGGSFNKQGNLQGLSWVATRQIKLRTSWPESRGSVIYTIQMVSTTPYCLKAASLETALQVGMVGRVHSKDRGGDV